MRRSLLAGVVAVLLLTTLPGHANDPIQDLTNNAQRFVPHPVGVTTQLRYVFGPYVVPPGVDKNLITPDIPIQTGFITGVFPNLINPQTGQEFEEQIAHIHHAHWFRITSDNQYESYTSGLSWVFGTGEERTGGSLRDREAPSEGWRYGIFVDGTTPQALIFMLHNKSAAPISGYITLDVEFTPGTRDQIKQATGEDIHPLRGVLTGTTQHAISGLTGAHSTNGVLMQEYTTDFSGTLVASASHMHPGGKWVNVVNLGPRDSSGAFVCGTGKDSSTVADLDGDGLPGVTLFVSRKYEHVPAVWPYSEDYQMGGTQGGFRAPIHQGDVIKQYGVYDVKRSSTAGLPDALYRTDPFNTASSTSLDSIDGRQHAWYDAMSYTGMYFDTDPLAQPAATAITNAQQCTLASFAPKLIPSNGFSFSTNPRQTFETRAQWGHSDAVCGVPDPSRGNETFSCDATPARTETTDGPLTDKIVVANFLYLPGDQSLGQYPQVKRGSTLTLVSADVAIGVRHSFTSCPAPCDGLYVANYPSPDGLFDTGKLGNLDPVDGGLTTTEVQPTQALFIDPSKFGSNQVYTYFCTIHPWMRGGFYVVN